MSPLSPERRASRMLVSLMPTAAAVSSLNSGVETTARARATLRSMLVTARQIARIGGALSRRT